MITEAQLGWMAAILDMKAMFTRKANTMRATPQLVMIVETSRDGIVRKLATMTGGTEERRPQVKEGAWEQRACATHCPTAHVHHPVTMPATTRWSVTGSAMAVVLHSTIPYTANETKPYREYYAEALVNLVTEGQGSGAVRAATMRMLRLGWVIPAQMLAAVFPEDDPAILENILQGFTA